MKGLLYPAFIVFTVQNFDKIISLTFGKVLPVSDALNKLVNAAEQLYKNKMCKYDIISKYPINYISNFSSKLPYDHQFI